VLADVCMPDLGYELAAMIDAALPEGVHHLRVGRDDGRPDGCAAEERRRLRAVPVVPEILQAKVSIFAGCRKTRARGAERRARATRRGAHGGARGDPAALQADRRRTSSWPCWHELRNPLAPIRTRCSCCGSRLSEAHSAGPATP
jgi:hypothetical protein